jgi:glycerate dehydrogenase
MNPGDLSWDRLAEIADLVVYDRTPATLTLERCAGADIVLTNKVVLSAEIIAQLPELKYVGLTSTGTNSVDLEAASKRGITVTNVPAYSTMSVAQMVFAYILEFSHHVRDHASAVRDGEWTASPDFCFWKYPQVELDGKSMGIIGFGSIGKQVARIASAFGMHVIAASRSRQNPPDIDNFEWADIDDVLRRSDYVSLHIPLTAETEGIINRETLSIMKPTAILINTGRGPLVVDSDLAEALNTGRIAGAALDVLTVEPPPADNPLLSAKNCIITPHIGWATYEARTRLMDVVVKNLEGFLNGRPVNLVSK